MFSIRDKIWLRPSRNSKSFWKNYKPFVRNIIGKILSIYQKVRIRKVLKKNNPSVALNVLFDDKNY